MSVPFSRTWELYRLNVIVKEDSPIPCLYEIVDPNFSGCLALTSKTTE